MASSVELYCYGVTWAGCIAAVIGWRKERKKHLQWEKNAIDCARTLRAAHRYVNWLREPGGPDYAAVPVPLVFEAGKICAHLLSESWLAPADRQWITSVRDQLGEYL